MKEKQNAVVYFLKTGIWLAPEENFSGIKKFSFKLLKVLLLSIRGYIKNSSGTRVAALTFYSFLSVVPVVAVVFAISKGFDLDKTLQTMLLSEFPQQDSLLKIVFQYADAMLEKTRGEVIAGAGVALLLWTIINLLSAVEEAFNNIWKVESRSIGRKVADYFSFSFVGPVFFLIATSATVALMSRVKIVAAVVAEWGISPLPILIPLRLMPFLLVWAMFSFIFIWMPNTRVRWSAGIGAGIIAGTSYQLTQWVYIAFQVGVARNNAIYGSLAAIPLFLAWAQISWTIVLFGAEISHAIQDLDTLGFPEKSEKVSPYHRKILAILIVREIAKSFQDGKVRPTLKEIAAKLKMPSSLTGSILSDLSGVGLVTTVQSGGKDSEETWQPGKDIHQLTVSSIIEAIDWSGTVELDFPMSSEFQATSGVLEEFERTLDASPANRLILDL